MSTMTSHTATRRITPVRAALATLALAFATIAGAWIFEAYGYLPCELCLQQRWAYYAGVPLAALSAALALAGKNGPARLGLSLLAVLFFGSAIFGAYHAGVEWGFWPGPSGCTGAAGAAAPSMDAFLSQLQTVKVVRCDQVAIRILGLSLAGWNAIVSAAICGLSLLGARSARPAA
ncbi:MAG: disulfide bond formation protein [Hyphomicrobiales bacterium]|nr:disulfide bond formation protein [Hyphomicrobiales bacterium]